MRCKDDVFLPVMQQRTHSYSTAIQGGRPVRVRYTITGCINVVSYLAFVADRAAWFGLSTSASVDNGTITVLASGPEAMLGALEMACTLGPIDALVDELRAEEEAEPPPAGFRGQR
jgi:acylphosphatase